MRSAQKLLPLPREPWRRFTWELRSSIHFYFNVSFLCTLNIFAGKLWRNREYASWSSKSVFFKFVFIIDSSWSTKVFYFENTFRDYFSFSTVKPATDLKRIHPWGCAHLRPLESNGSREPGTRPLQLLQWAEVVDTVMIVMILSSLNIPASLFLIFRALPWEGGTNAERQHWTIMEKKYALALKVNTCSRRCNSHHVTYCNQRTKLSVGPEYDDDRRRKCI